MFCLVNDIQISAFSGFLIFAASHSSKLMLAQADPGQRCYVMINLTLSNVMYLTGNLRQVWRTACAQNVTFGGDICSRSIYLVYFWVLSLSSNQVFHCFWMCMQPKMLCILRLLPRYEAQRFECKAIAILFLFVTIFVCLRLANILFLNLTKWVLYPNLTSEVALKLETDCKEMQCCHWKS